MTKSSGAWIHLTDGPGKGKKFYAQRTPKFIRAVSDRNGNWNVLDLPDDEPTRDEEIFVYRQTSHSFVRGTEGGLHALYSYVEISGSQKGTLRYKRRWQEWATLQVAAA